jgi:hypothetical protein
VIKLKRWNDPDKPLDGQFAELIETVWASEKTWALMDRIDAAVRLDEIQARRRESRQE